MGSIQTKVWFGYEYLANLRNFLGMTVHFFKPASNVRDIIMKYTDDIFFTQTCSSPRIDDLMFFKNGKLLLFSNSRDKWLQVYSDDEGIINMLCDFKDWLNFDTNDYDYDGGIEEADADKKRIQLANMIPDIAERIIFD